IALNVGLLVNWLHAREGNAKLLAPVVLRGLSENLEEQDAGTGPRPIGQRLANISTTALNDFIDIMAFLVLGAFLATAGRVALAGSNLQNVIQAQPVVAILLMMGIAVLFCLCSEADAFVAA